MAPYTALRSSTATPKKSTPILKRKKSTDTAELNLSEKGIGSADEVSDDDDDIEVFGAEVEEVVGREQDEEGIEDSLEDTQMLLNKETEEDEGVGTAIDTEVRTGIRRFVSISLFLICIQGSLVRSFINSLFN